MVYLFSGFGKNCKFCICWKSGANFASSSFVFVNSAKYLTSLLGFVFLIFQVNSIKLIVVGIKGLNHV